MIYVDSREPADLISMVRDRADEVRVEKLDSGDFLVRDTLFERKRYSDLIGRMHDNENGIFTQMMAAEESVSDSDVGVCLLLEGDLEEQLREHNANPRTEFVGKKRIMRLLAGLYKMGFDMTYTVDKERTAQFIVGLERDSTSGPSTIRNAAGDLPLDEWPRFLTQGFDKVGAKTADNLLDEFDSFQAIVNADVEELKAADGVGTKTAEHIYEVVRHVDS